MSNYTTDLYEVKREILMFSKEMSKGLSKTNQKFVSDMIYGINVSGSLMLSEISRGLQENIKLVYGNRKTVR
jgi:hypothetical protein